MEQGLDHNLSEDMRNFILEKIESVGHLEVLRLLATDKSKHRTPQEVGQELRTNPSLAFNQLESLVHHQLLTRIEENKYQFSSVSSEDLNRVEELLNLFRDRRRVIINLIYSKPAERVRNLADAFKLRKED